MRHTTITVTRALLVLALGAACALTSYAQDDAVTPKIATVSLARVQAGYTQLHTQEIELGQWLQSRKSYHDQLTNFVFLPKKEFEESVELVRKEPPLAEADQTRLGELLRISDKNDARFAELQAKPDRTAEETAEFNALQDMYDASVGTLKSLQQSIVEELGTKRNTALAGLMDTVQQAVIDTAKDGGYDLVLDADMVFYGGEDITDAVIERLNAGTEQPAAAQPAADQPATDQPVVGETGQQGEQGGAGGGQQTGGQGG